MPQDWDPEIYARNARFVAELGMPVVEWLDPKPGERILDLGCGDGALTERLVGVGRQVVGVDGSEEQVAAARRRGLDARVMDGQSLVFDAEFDAVFSNAALHWMKRPEAVVAGVWRALRPGGRFVAEMGGHGNVAAVHAALGRALLRRDVDPQGIDPWYFPTAEAYRALLESSGFIVRSAVLFPRPTPLPGDISDWLATFALSFTRALPPAERDGLVAEVAEELRPALCDARGVWAVDYVRLRFAALRPVV